MTVSVIVLGLGAMGSATAQHLAEQGHRVTGFDRFAPPHTRGSSHGQTRIIRQSYWEDPRYVPLLLRAYELWRRLEADTGQSLLHLTGGIMIGPADGDLVTRSAHSARQFNLPHQVLSPKEIKGRCPMFTVENGMAALWEDAAGFLLPEACVQQQLNRALHSGADLHYNEQALEWIPLASGGVSVRTAQRVYEADRLVIAAGPWASEALGAAKLPLEVTRQILYWFEPLTKPELFQQGRFPVFIVQPPNTDPVLYGFPSVSGFAPDSGGVKVALHGSRDICTPGTVVREISQKDEDLIRQRLGATIPSVAGRLLRAETCLYTMTPDEHFILDQHPDYPQVTVAAGFSGHGFKFASVIGEVLAGMVVGRAPDFDLNLFSIRRFQTGQQ